MWAAVIKSGIGGACNRRILRGLQSGCAGHGTGSRASRFLPRPYKPVTADIGGTCFDRILPGHPALILIRHFKPPTALTM